MAKSSANDIWELQHALDEEHVQRTSCHMALTHLTNTTVNTVTTALQPMVSDCVVAPDESRRDHDEGMLLGLSYTFAYMLCSDIASIISELFLKSEKDTPFYIQKATMESMGIPILFVMSFLGPFFGKLIGQSPSRWAPQMWWAAEGFSFMGSADALAWCADHMHHGHAVHDMPCGIAAGGFWREWNQLAPWGALFFGSCQSWFAGVLVKLMSSVVKLLAKIVSMGGVFFIGDCWVLYEDSDGDLKQAGVAAVQISLLTFTFLNIKTPKDELPKVSSEAPGGATELPERPQNV